MQASYGAPGSSGHLGEAEAQKKRDKQNKKLMKDSKKIVARLQKEMRGYEKMKKTVEETQKFQEEANLGGAEDKRQHKDDRGVQHNGQHLQVNVREDKANELGNGDGLRRASQRFDNNQSSVNASRDIPATLA